MKTSILLFVLLPVMISCSSSKKPLLAPEAIYDDQELSVITSSFNNKQQTIAVLYGNAAALKAATDSTAHEAGEDYRLVTWQQEPAPRWFGGNINGAIKTIERVSTSMTNDGSVKISYELVKGVVNMEQAGRIAYILEQKAAVFP